MKNFKTVGLTVLGIFSLILLGIFIINGVGNKAIALEEKIKVADSGIKIQEKRRVDLLYNLVDTVKQYDKHESNTLKEVVDARSSGGNANISEVKTMISATAEAYPQLKSDANYKQLMNEMSTTENLIAQYRDNYAKQIETYNRYVKKFPNKQFLNMLGYEAKGYIHLDFNAPVDAPTNLFEGK